MKWISVKDRLPPSYEYVLVYAQMEGTGEPSPISIGRYCEKRWECFKDAVACGDLSWELDVKSITHWMELPKEPNEIRN